MQITKEQRRKMKKVFSRSGRTFQSLAEEAGLVNVPDHLEDLTKNEARRLLKFCGPFLNIGKEKQ